MENLLSNLTTGLIAIHPFWTVINLLIVLYIIWEMRKIRTTTETAAGKIKLEAMSVAAELKKVANDAAKELVIVAKQVSESLKQK